MLESCAAFLTDDQISVIVNTLNRNDGQSLHVQWELALLFALNQIGIVAYEPQIGNRKPDISWTAHQTAEVMIADVRTISDSGLEGENPREFYRAELRRRVELLGLNPNNFWDDPRGRLEGPRGNQKMRLMYPKASECRRLFNGAFDAFLHEIKDQGLAAHRRRFTGDDFDVTITYNVATTSHGGGNPSYTVYYSLTKNPVYRALQEKAKQLRDTHFRGPCGIILADGGCHGLTRKFRDPTGMTYSDEQVIRRFFSNTTSVAFVITAYVESRREFLTSFGAQSISGKFFANPRARFSISEATAAELRKLPSLLPPPKLNGWNAANHLKNGWDGPDKGWYVATGVTVRNLDYEFKVSARALLDLLAGRITREKFAEMHSGAILGGDSFKVLLERGYIIQDARFTPLADQDDDHVIITLRPDVSAGPYHLPPR